MDEAKEETLEPDQLTAEKNAEAASEEPVKTKDSAG